MAFDKSFMMNSEIMSPMMPESYSKRTLSSGNSPTLITGNSPSFLGEKLKLSSGKFNLGLTRNMDFIENVNRDESQSRVATMT